MARKMILMYQKIQKNNKKRKIMKLNRLKAAFIGLGLISGLQVSAQKSNVTSAAIEYKKFDMAFMQGDMETAKEVLLNCKEYLDPAMEHEKTKDDGKAHLYNGKIHFGLMLLSAATQDESLEKFQSEENKERYEKSLKFAHGERKYKRDVEDFVNKWISLSSTGGTQSFNNEDYVSAFAGFAGAYDLSKILGEPDEDMKNNALVSANNAVAKFQEKDELDKALSFIEQTKEVFPANTELAIKGVNIALEQGDFEKAEKFFEAAAEADPDNKLLFTSMGSIYLSNGDKLAAELKDMDVTDEKYAETAAAIEEMFDKSEKNLKRALEIDPKDMNASYNLGVLYLGKGEKLTLKANTMDLNDPRYQNVIDESEEMYTKAIEPLEIYIEQDPENAGVLQVLFQVHRKAGNTEKALEYKRRAEEAAGE